MSVTSLLVMEKAGEDFWVQPFPITEVFARLKSSKNVVPAARMLRGWAFEVPPPGAGLKTVTWAVPVAAMSEAGMDAVTCVAETNVVVRADPFHCTTDPETKLLPFTVSENAAAPTMAELGLRLVVVGRGLPFVMVKVCGFETPPPGAGLKTVTWGLPLTAMSLAGMAAVSCEVETNV